MIKQCLVVGSVVFMLVMVTSCATTTAPTESSTKTFDKTTNAALDLTSSTSPGSSNSGSAGVEDFTRVNFAAVKKEMAAGGGEHLTALARLLHIPSDKEKLFFQLTKAHFPSLYPSDRTTPVQMLATLNRTLLQSPQLMPTVAALMPM